MDIIKVCNILSKLYLRKQPVSFEEIPEEVKPELNNYLIGQTLMLVDNKPMIPYLVFWEWFNSFMYKKEGQDH